MEAVQESWDDRPVQPLQQFSVQDMREFNPPTRFMSDLFYCMSRPQYKRSCGLSSLVSCWNHLFSRLGKGTLQPITVEQCLILLGITKQLEDVADREQQDQNYTISNNQIVNRLDFGRFTGNTTLLTWFRLLCKKFEVKGRASIAYYPSSKKTYLCSTPEQARRELLLGLTEGRCFIYHCHDHYMTPYGFYLNPEQQHRYTLPKQPSKQLQEEEEEKEAERTPCLQEQAEVEADVKPPEFDRATVILIGEPSKRFAPFHEVSWSEMDHDMRTPWYNIRRKDRGLGKGRGARQGATNKCIMMFERIA